MVGKQKEVSMVRGEQSEKKLERNSGAPQGQLSLEEHSEYFVLYPKRHGRPSKLKTRAVTHSLLVC